MDTNKFYNIFVGAETGILKGVNAERGNWDNITNVEKADKNKEIACLCWNNEYLSEICIGRRDQTVSVFDSTANSVVRELKLDAGKGCFKGLCKLNSDYITCTESGSLKLWSSDAASKIEINVGDNVCCMHNNPAQQNLVATGGKENDLKLWSLDGTTKPLFTAKNVRNDWLDLRVPVWVEDLSFVPGSQQIITCTNYHQVRLYDPACGVRRPQLEVLFDDSPIKALSIRPNSPLQVIVGNANGGMALIDLRGKGSVVQRYKGAEGGIRAVACHPNEDIVVSCGLDRYLRIHDINNKQLIHKIYMKSRLNCLLLSSKSTPADESVKSDVSMSEVCGDDAEESESETEDVLWSAMAKVKTNAKRQLDNDASEDETAATTRRNVKRRKQKRKTAKSSNDSPKPKKMKVKKQGQHVQRS